MAQNNLETLDKLVSVLNRENITKDEFINSFQKVVELVLKIQTQTAEAIKRIEQTHALLLNKTHETYENNYKDIKKQTNELFVGQKLNEMSASQKTMFDSLKTELNKMLDRKLSETHREAMNRAKPGQPGPKGNPGSPDTAGQIRDKLETLKNEDRVDVSAIRGLDELVKELKTSFGKVRMGVFGRGGGFAGPFRTLTVTGAVNGTNDAFTIDKDYAFIMLYWNGQFQQPTTHYTRAGRTCTFTAGNIPTAGTIHGVGQL